MSRLPTVDTLLAFIGDRPIEAFDFGAGLDGPATLSLAFGAVELVIHRRARRGQSTRRGRAAADARVIA